MAVESAITTVLAKGGPKAVGKGIPVIGGVVSAGFTLWNTGAEIYKGNYTKAGAEFAAGSLESVGCFFGGFLLGEPLRQGAVEAIDISSGLLTKAGLMDKPVRPDDSLVVMAARAGVSLAQGENLRIGNGKSIYWPDPEEKANAPKHYTQTEFTALVDKKLEEQGIKEIKNPSQRALIERRFLEAFEKQGIAVLKDGTDAPLTAAELREQYQTLRKEEKVQEKEEKKKEGGFFAKITSAISSVVEKVKELSGKLWNMTAELLGFKAPDNTHPGEADKAKAPPAKDKGDGKVIPPDVLAKAEEIGAAVQTTNESAPPLPPKGKSEELTPGK